MSQLFPSTDRDPIDLTDSIEVSGMHGSSASPGERPNLTPSSSKRDPRLGYATFVLYTRVIGIKTA